MAVKAPAKPDRTQKQLKAAHHRHSKTYLKTYWPYLPILGIAVLALAINHFWKVQPSNTTMRLSAYTYYDLLESTIGVLALSIFLLRHAFAWHKVFVKGEVFIAKHPLADITLAVVAAGGLLLAHHNIVII